MTSDQKLIEKSGLSIETIEKNRTELGKIKNIEKVKIYGSRAKGTFRLGSDIDLCLFGPNLHPRDLLTLEENLEELLLPYSFDVSIYQNIENPDFTDHIDRVGISF